MKKILATVLFIFALAASQQAFAQYQKGDKLLNLGLGLGSYYGGGVPIGASLEFGVTDNISVGPQIDYYSWSYGYVGYKWRYTFIPIGVRGSYHANELLNLNNDKLDLYGGVSLGYYISKYSDNTGYTGTYDNAYGGRAFLGVHVGGRYYFKPNLGGFAELGYGVSTLKVGVAFKF